MCEINFKDYKFSAIDIPDDHSPSLASKSTWAGVNHTQLGRSFGLIARCKKTDVPILSIYGIEVVDFNQTRILFITNIVFGNQSYPDFEIENTEYTLTKLFSYMITRLGWSTDAPIDFIDIRDIKAESYLASYNTNHLYPTQLIREWFQNTNTATLLAEISSDMNAKIKATHPNYLYRLVSNCFNASFVTKWMTYGWDGPFYLEVNNEENTKSVSVNLIQYPGLVGEDENLFTVWRYSQVTYMGLEKWFKSESFAVKFVGADDADGTDNRSVHIPISLTNEQMSFISKTGNISDFIQNLINDAMNRDNNVAQYEPLTKLKTRIKKLQETRRGKLDSALSEISQTINRSFHLFIASIHGDNDQWQQVLQHTTKVEEVDRNFLNSPNKYKCLELTVQERPGWSPLLCDLTGGINILVSPTHNINDRNGVVYKCVAFNSEIRRNATIYSGCEPFSSTIRMLVIDRFGRDAGFEAKPYSFAKSVLNSYGDLNTASASEIFKTIESDIVIR